MSRQSLRRAGAIIAAAFLCSARWAEAGEPLGRAASLDLPILRLVVGLILSIIIAVMTVLVLRRFMRPGAMTGARLGRVSWLMPAPRQISIEETQRASLHGDVCLVRWGEKQFLVVIAQGGVTLLDSRTAPAEDAAP